MLVYVEGSSPHPRPWADDVVAGVGRLLRGLHAAAATFVPPPGAAWRPWFDRDLGGSRPVFGHCDTGPWNIIARDGRPVALVDFEFAGPVDAVWELAQAARLNAQLHDDVVAEWCRLADAAAAERGQIGPVPLGLINRNTHRLGTRPPFGPAAVIGAIRRVLARPRLPARQITDLVGPPDFITGCTITGDLAAFAAGQRTELGLHARVTVTDAAGVRARVIKAAGVRLSRTGLSTYLARWLAGCCRLGRPRGRYLAAAVAVAGHRDAGCAGEPDSVDGELPGAART
jgi:hypothetical protein